MFANAVVKTGAQAFFYIKKVTEAAAVVGFKLLQIQPRMIHRACAGKTHNAKTIANAVAQFGLAGGIVAVAVTAVVIAAHQFVAAQGRHQVKRLLVARHAGIVNIEAKHQALAQAQVVAGLNAEQSARIVIAAVKAFVQAHTGRNKHTARGIGVVVAGIERKAGAKVNAGAAAAVLDLRVGIKNTGCGSPAKGIVIKSRKEAEVKVLAVQLFAAQVNAKALLAHQFGVGAAGIAANAIKITRKVDITHPRYPVEGVMRHPIVGTHAQAALALGGNGAVGEDVGYAGFTVDGIGIKAVQDRCAHLNTRFGRAAQHRQRGNAAMAAAILNKEYLAQKVGQKPHLRRGGRGNGKEDDKAAEFFHGSS